jgi:hypothetical protein
MWHGGRWQRIVDIAGNERRVFNVNPTTTHIGVGVLPTVHRHQIDSEHNSATPESAPDTSPSTSKLMP